MSSLPPSIQLIPLQTEKIVNVGDDLWKTIENALAYNKYVPKERSVLVIAETVVALCQNRVFKLPDVPPEEVSSEACRYADRYKMDPRLVQMILNEAHTVIGGLPGLLLTEKNGILIANAGIDKSNSGGEGMYSLWPADPFKEAKNISANIKRKYGLKQFGVIISDSRVQIMRRGVTGIAIGVAGFDPIIDLRGRKDLFGNVLKFTTRAMADQLADAAHLLMGESDERIPFVMVENAPVIFTDRVISPSELLMPPEEDLFIKILKLSGLFNQNGKKMPKNKT